MARYNNMYDRIVQGENDIIGYVAYALYKESKAEYIATYKSEHGQEPADEVVAEFLRAIGTDANISRFRMQAEEMIQGIIVEELREQVQQIRKDLNEQMSSKITEAVKDGSPTTWTAIWQGIVTSVIIAGLVYIFKNFSF